MQGSLKIITITSTKNEVEEVLFTTFDPYQPGNVASVKVTTQKFESFRINVKYDWVFSFEDDVEEGGSLEL